MEEYYIWCSTGFYFRTPLVYVTYFWNMRNVVSLTMQMIQLIANNTEEVIENLTNVTQKLFTWFANNQMDANHDKCHLLLSTQEEANIQIANTTIKCSQSKKILGIILDNQLKFDKHVENICQKASRKSNALARLANYMELPKRRILMDAFFKAQFNYCPAF